QQARPHRLGGSSQGARFRVREDQWDGAPTCLMLAPCSGRSRRGLATLGQVASKARRPALTAPARGAPVHPQAGTKERPPSANKGTARSKETTDGIANNLPASVREDETKMQDRSSRRMRTLVTRMARSRPAR